MRRTSAISSSHAGTPADRPRADAYTCPELGRTCARPGAYDAFDLPSLYGRRLHFPDGRVILAAESTTREVDAA
jgi:hypothetical protein